jgi:NitT/TauT family transport system ATP-binding protein
VSVVQPPISLLRTGPDRVGCDDAPILSARNIVKLYAAGSAAEVVALDNIAFDIFDGELISIVGPSGCGKSTLLRILAGLARPSGGEVLLSGAPLRGPGPQAAMVFQQPVLLPWRTVMENVLLPIEFRELPIPPHRARARELLQNVGLAGFENRHPHELSGGMQQRAAIVRALVQDPQILLMDEPFGALDAMTREQMNLDVLRLWQASRKTIVFVTHSISEAIFLSQRVFVMTPRPGRLAAIIDIDLPYPRGLDVINTERFGAHAARVRDLLHARGDIS